jgi:polysaccharide export outer membrane protein
MLPGSLWAQETAAPDARMTASGLAPGDEIGVHLYDFPDLGGAMLNRHVMADGTIHLPYAGTVQVSGMGSEEAERAIAEALRTRGIVKEPNVAVDVVTATNLQAYVLGEVRNPKSIPVYAPVTISYVLGQVGGTTGLAAFHLTIIHHSDESPTSVDYDPDTPTSAAMNTLVRAGDIVNVSRMGVFFVVGEVIRAGVFPMGGGLSIGAPTAASGYGVVKHMTLLQAIAMAGGITPIAQRSKTRILRTVDGKREEIIVDLLKLSRGEVADPLIHPDDIIYVPSSYWRSVTNNIFPSAISAAYVANLYK